MRSALLVAAAGTFLALSAGVSSAANGEPTTTTASQSDTSAQSQAGSPEAPGEQPAEQEPAPEPEPAQDEEPQSAPAEQPAPQEEQAAAETQPSEPATQESSTQPSTPGPSDQGGSTTPSPGSSEGSGEAETPVQTEDSGSTAVLDRVTRRTARRAGATDVVDGAAATIQRSSAQTTDLIEDGTTPDLGDIDSMTEPLRSVVEDRLAAGYLPDLGDVPAGSDAPSPAQEPATERRTRGASAGQLPPTDVVRRDALSATGADGLRPTPQFDWTSVFDAGSGDTDAAAHREGPASPNPLPGWGDALTASSSAPGGFDLASAAPSRGRRRGAGRCRRIGLPHAGCAAGRSGRPPWFLA